MMGEEIPARRYKVLRFPIEPFADSLDRGASIARVNDRAPRSDGRAARSTTSASIGSRLSAAARLLAVIAALVSMLVVAPPAMATGSGPMTADATLSNWYRLVLELVRHTPTYTPPVASRTFAYVGITAYEAVASGNPTLVSLAGQVNGLTALPKRDAGQTYSEAVVLNAALTAVVTDLFSNTGPTGQRAMSAMTEKLRAAVATDVPADVVARSEAFGAGIADHVLAWSRTDGGAVIVNQGFPLDYELASGPANWKPTSTFVQQQKPLLPLWGANRAFAMPDGAACPLPPPPEYSEDKGSTFYKQAYEVYDTVRNLTPEQRAIAKFWADDAMLSVTPPGHWVSIAAMMIKRENLPLDRAVELMARLGISLGDAFIGCWHAKFEYDLLRPVTYIRRVIDKTWEPVLITPPFPEYPSGHSTQSGAAAEVLTAFFGDDVAFVDETGSADGLEPRSFRSFHEAANEAGISRLYGGIHFREAIDRGLAQGRCIGAYATALRTRN